MGWGTENFRQNDSKKFFTEGRKTVGRALIITYIKQNDGKILVMTDYGQDYRQISVPRKTGFMYSALPLLLTL
jgi:hypothetical protein